MVETNPVVDKYGTQRWYDEEGELHRDGLPTVIKADGTQFWFQHGKFHRDNGLPAIIYTSGMQFWFQHGKFIKASSPDPARQKGKGVERWQKD